MHRFAAAMLGAFTCYLISSAAWSAESSASGKIAAAPAIEISDVTLFYKIYDAAGGHPTADKLQNDYLDRGSEGMHQFVKMRNITGARIEAMLVKRPEIYSGAKRCMNVLPAVRKRSDSALRKLLELYPEARTPTVTIAVGRGKPV